MALGAAPADLLALVMGQGARLIAAGVLVGLLCARALAMLLSATLFDVQPGDAATFAGVGIALTIIGLLASYVPALQATRIDPNLALRSE
jgi:putative ABC transport system permease protein